MLLSPSGPRTVALALLLCLAAVPLGASPADAAVHRTVLRHYQNCTAVHRVFSGGIARAGVTVDHAGGTSRLLKGKVRHSNALYRANRKLDRDHDGVACEQA